MGLVTAVTGRAFSASATLGLLLSSGACVSRPPATAPLSPPAAVETNVGFATFYADAFHGRKTASGVPFDMHALVAAHPTLPFGSTVRLTNLANGRSVEVRIVDRGPAKGPRSRGVVIDLSRRAAEELDFISRGRARVRLEVLDRGADDP
jgi:rare lipoprotein A